MEGRQEKRHSSEVAAARERRSKRTIFKRTVILMVLCGVMLFVPLFWRLWDVAIVHHEDYQSRATKQQTLDLSVSAARGNIYDCNGNVLAMSATVYNLILSPKDLMQDCVDKKDYTDDDGKFHEFGRVLTTPKYSAYIRIGEGCDNWCSYCAIPMIRGGYRSRPKADILAEVRKLAAQGVKEFTLIAQDTTRYGTDDGGESQLPQLIEEIAAIPGVEWLRALYCYPERVDERLLDTMKRLPNVCDYLDLPMQHISQHILTDMNRTDTSAHIREVCRMFKERGMMLRTTLMVGFPGETEEDFDELMDFVKEIKFDRMGAFMFCPEDGTRAAEMPDQIPEEVKQERYDRLMTLQHGVSLAQNKARVGTTCRVLVEKKRGSRYVGRSEYEAPETDGSIFFGSEEPCEIGSFVNVKITAAKAYDLMGERV